MHYINLEITFFIVGLLFHGSKVAMITEMCTRRINVFF